MKMSRVFIGLLLLMVVSCAREDIQLTGDANDLTEEQLALKEQVDQYILSSIRSTDQPFNWNHADDELILDALSVSDGFLVVGYRGERADGRVLQTMKSLIREHRSAEELESEYLPHENPVLKYFYVKVDDMALLKAIRQHESTVYVEVLGYPFDLSQLIQSDRQTPSTDPESSFRNNETVLDPQSTTPYPDQVAAFDGGLRTVIRRHNMETVYNDYELFGEEIGLAILDNGILPEREPFFDNNGYGDRIKRGYYNPLWFLPFTQPDGYAPQPFDVFGLSILVYDTYYIHGSEMAKMALTLAPNANIHSVRASTWTVILSPSQVFGIANAIMALADDSDVRMISMSMGTIFETNEIRSAIEYFHSKGKLFVCSAGTTFEGLQDLLGVLFPGQLPETTVTTAIQNRETTGGEFVLGGASHGGPQNDFTIENTGSSSVATSRAAGMIALIWSANPSLSRDELLDVLIRSSFYYQLQGAKHEIFGWGTIDAGLAVELALAE